MKKRKTRGYVGDMVLESVLIFGIFALILFYPILCVCLLTFLRFPANFRRFPANFRRSHVNFRRFRQFLHSMPCIIPLHTYGKYHNSILKLAIFGPLSIHPTFKCIKYLNQSQLDGGENEKHLLHSVNFENYLKRLPNKMGAPNTTHVPQ